MKTKLSLSQKAGLVSVGLFAVLLLVWQLAIMGKVFDPAKPAEYLNAFAIKRA